MGLDICFSIKSVGYACCLCIIMNSCSDKLVGTYFSGSRILKLSLDSSYKYEEQLCLLSHTSEGKWQFVDGKIILNNYFPQ
jgi:hypothetical protein